jgi:hypothetical protein
MKVLSAIFCGPTLMIDVDGVFLLEVLVIHLAKTSRSNSTIQITWFVLLVLISL